MNKIKTILLILCIVLTSCRTEKKEEKQIVEKELTLLEKVANASGHNNWNKVKELQFTFNVDRDTSHFERTWVWQPKANMVTMISKNDTLTYNRTKVDSISDKANRSFINDKYWFLAPFNLVWDKGSFTEAYSENEIAPISQKPMHKLTIVYGSEGGYTPGDAYDFYFGDDYLVKEWAFRRGNKPEPSLVSTWEDYIEKGGLKMAKMHTNNDGFKLYFTNIEVKTE
ncbi:MAG: hypothetical protein KAJ23_15885 [Maribacter sp.]|nr:hypothetical protein [Maribacter sp.]